VKLNAALHKVLAVNRHTERPDNDQDPAIALVNVIVIAVIIGAIAIIATKIFM
jgi:hypothetical protein